MLIHTRTETFNEFFYRKLKPDARPVEEPDNPYRLVSGADCRMMAFETVQDATRIWIKGREFTVARLLGDAYKSQAERYQGGALAIFRLAPQDYHRFHSPVDGTIGPITYIAGEYYTVNVGRRVTTYIHSALMSELCSPKPSERPWTSTGRTLARSYLSTVHTSAASWLFVLGP
jgi:phosphatidylserine decarboxylase precursor